MAFLSTSKHSLVAAETFQRSIIFTTSYPRESTVPDRIQVTTMNKNTKTHAVFAELTIEQAMPRCRRPPYVQLGRSRRRLLEFFEK